MKDFLIEETPGKVLSLVGASLLSFVFLFAVAYTDASFGQTYAHFPDPFSSAKVVSVVDNAAQGYSNFLAANFLQPLSSDYKLYAENIAWLSEQSGLTAFLGLDSGQRNLALAQQNAAQVAGASVVNYQSSGSFNIDQIYSLLIK